MRTLINIDTKDYNPNGTVHIRPSVRGIIVRNGKVAMVHSRKYNYYKFPGGGLEPGETHEQALIREVAEETGLVVIPDSIHEYGMVHRKQRDHIADIFIQDNFYYLCDVEQEVMHQDLDDYEAEESFTLAFVDPGYAIRINKEEDHGPKSQTMITRDAGILEILLQEGIL